MSHEWYVVRANKEVGPLSTQRLKTLADDGKLNAEHLVRRSDQDTPRKAGTIKGLFDEEADEEDADDPAIPKAKPKISKKTVIIIACAATAMLLLCCVGTGFMAFFGDKMGKAARADLAAADAMWDKGDKVGGATKYQKLVDDNDDRWLKEDERPRLYGRLIDYKYEKGDGTSGKALIDKADKAGIVPAVNHPDAKNAVAAVQSAKKAKETPVARKKSKYTRDEFKGLVMGKSKSEVLELLGKPRETQELGDLGEYWYYGGITFDPITDRTDNIAQITFQRGRATSVLFT